MFEHFTDVFMLSENRMVLSNKQYNTILYDIKDSDSH